MDTHDTEHAHQKPKGKPPLDPALSFTPEEAATYLGVSTKTMAKWRCHRKGPSFVKIGRVITYRGRDLLSYEARCVIEIGEAA